MKRDHLGPKLELRELLLDSVYHCFNAAFDLSVKAFSPFVERILRQ